MKVLLASACAALLLPTSASQAEVAPIPELLRFFNDCAGQVAAHLSIHGWNGAAGVNRHHLESIDAVLSNLAPPEQRQHLMARQSAARAAHVALLAHAMETGDMAALNRAADHIAQCRAAVLEP